MVLLDNFLFTKLLDFWHFTGFYNFDYTNLIMILVGLFFIYLAIKHDFEPMLLVPIGFGILIGNKVCATDGTRHSSSWASVR